MTTPINYYGGKARLVSELLPLIPYHKQYVELFCGGASLLFAKPKSENEVINDKNEWVTTFFKVCKTQFKELQILIRATMHSEAEHARASHILKNTSDFLPLEIAWALWVQANMSFGHKIFSGFAFSNGGQGKATANKRDDFTEEYCERLKDVEVFQRDALDIIDLKDKEDTLFYVDPPYVSSNQGHYKGYTEEDFVRLLDRLANIKGKFLLSSYPEACLIEYRASKGWRYKDIDMVLQVTGKRDTTKYKTESITFNYELPQQRLFA